MAAPEGSDYKLHPDIIHMKNNDKTKRILAEAAQTAWQNIDMRHLEQLPETMPNMVRVIIESEGWCTRAAFFNS